MDFSPETMAKRISVRSYDGRPIPAESLRALSEAMDACVPGPFGGRARFAVVSPDESGKAGSDKAGPDKAGPENAGPTEGDAARLLRSGKIGTYGLISKVPAFLVGAVAKGRGALEDFGYSMEGLVLKATELGLGSCWIGGIFGRGAAAAVLDLGQDELLPAVVSIGMPADRKTVADSLTRRFARADTRKPASALFFDGEIGKPLDIAASPWRDAFEALRMAPSASNKQPWRILRSGPANRVRFDLLLAEDRKYNSMLGEIRLQNIDMGIAMRHFESAARSLGLPGSWVALDPPPQVVASPFLPIASWLG